MRWLARTSGQELASLDDVHALRQLSRSQLSRSQLWRSRRDRARGRAINRVLGRAGKVFAYRYHATAIASPRQMRNALSYVLNNWRRHDEDEGSEAAHRAALDPYSTAIHFRGWREGEYATPAGFEPLPSAAPQTWLLRVGWERRGPISAWDVPGRL